MADFNTFIKLHRSILDSAVFSDAEVLRLWIYLLCKASVDDRQIIFDGRVIDIKKGQLITGRKKLAEHLNTTESKAYRSLKLLQKLGCVDIKVNNRFSLVTLVNWGKFQGATLKNEQQNNNRPTTEPQQPYSRTTAERQQNNTNKNVKECINNVNNDRMNEDAFMRSLETQKIKSLNGELGAGIVMLSEEQIDSLLDILSLEEFNKYVSIVRDCELSGKKYRKSHYQAIIDMVKKDREI